MKFLKAKTTQNKIEFFNVARIMTIQPNGETTKILIAANLYWWVFTDTTEIVDINEVVNL